MLDTVNFDAWFFAVGMPPEKPRWLEKYVDITHKNKKSMSTGLVMMKQCFMTANPFLINGLRLMKKRLRYL